MLKHQRIFLWNLPIFDFSLIFFRWLAKRWMQTVSRVLNINFFRLNLGVEDLLEGVG